MTSGGRRERGEPARTGRGAPSTRRRGARTDRRGTATRASARPRTPGAATGPTRTARIDDDASLTQTGEHEIDLDEVVDDPERAVRPSRIRIPRRLPVGASSLAARWERLDAKRAIVLALVLSVIALTLAMPVRTYFAQRAEFQQLQAGNQQLRHEVTDYQQKVNEQGDPAYIEAQARQRLQFVRPGETPLVMMYPGDDARIAAQKREEARLHNPWYANLWDAVSTPPSTK